MTTTGNPNSGTICLADKSPTQRKTRRPRGKVMSARVYVLLDVVQEELAEVVQTLRGKPGVAMADVVEGSHDIIMVVEARGRQRLADLTIKAIGSVESMTKELELLLVTDMRENQTGTGKQQSRVRAEIKGREK
ncbi:MAG: hypothetical protein V1932_05855 [Chloroflexota bacterium]